MLELLAAKLRPPRPVSDLILRPQLVRLLDSACTIPLTLVSAPAGFGKTTLLVEWLESAALPAAWLSLDENDNDLTTFVSHLVAALASVFPNACQATRILLHAPRVPTPLYFARQLGNDIAALPAEFILILDDYHLLTNPAVLELMDELLRHQLSTLHLVLATRVHPTLPLSRLRARGQLLEIRAPELTFSAAEAEAFLNQSVPTALPAETLALILSRTEGWAAGLRLASISLRSQSDVTRYDQTFRDHGEHFVMDYLLEEVFARQSDEIQSFLLNTSILTEFTPALCDALSNLQGTGTSRSLIEQLRQANLFLITLDETNGWYRFHHLFASLLAQKREREYDAAQTALLHARASTWFASEGLVTEAIQHALAANLPEQAAEIVEANTHHALNHEGYSTLDRWTALLPPELLTERPALLLARIYALDMRLSPSAIAALLERSEELSAHAHGTKAIPLRALQGNIYSVRCRILFWQGQFHASIEAARRAFELLPPDHIYARGIAKMYFGLAHYALGETETAVRLLTKPIGDAPEEAAEITLRSLIALASAYLFAGDFAHLQQAAHSMYRIASAGNFAGSVAWAHRFLGLVHYEWNELYAAEQHFALASEMRYAANTRTAHESLVGLALCQQALGRTLQANETAAALVDFDTEIQFPAALTEAYALQARLALQQGDAATAWRLMPALREPPRSPFIWTEQSNVTALRIQIAHGSAQDLAQALDTTSECLARAQAIHDKRSMIQLLALQALALDQTGQTRAARSALERAVLLAERGGFIRSFVDFGPALGKLIDQVRGVAPEYAARVLAAFPSPALPPAILSAESPTSEHAALVEPLTGREMQVLELLAHRLSDQEVAAALVISKATAKTHVQHIFDKLGVNSRRTAVDTARNLGILSLG